MYTYIIIIHALIISFFFLGLIFNIKLMTKWTLKHIENSFILSFNRDAVKTHPVLRAVLFFNIFLKRNTEVYCLSLMKMWEWNRLKAFVSLSPKINGDFLLSPHETCLPQDKGFIGRKGQSLIAFHLPFFLRGTTERDNRKQNKNKALWCRMRSVLID